MTLNTSLLSTFAPGIRFGLDIKSMRRRFQALSIIYINLLVINGLISIGGLLFLLVKTKDPFQPLYSVLPLVITSLSFLRRGEIELAGIITIFYMFPVNFITSMFGEEPVIGLNALMVNPVTTFFMTSSLKVFITSCIITILMFCYYAHGLWIVYLTTFSEDHARQTLVLIVVAFIALFVIVASLLIQKVIESAVWEAAHTNYTRSEALTQEVLQAAEAKDTFVFSLSHEIRNPLNSVRGSIDYLVEVVQDLDHRRVLKNAKLGCEMLLNLLNNVLDAAKLKAEKMELSYSETNFVQIVKNLFIVNSENLKAKNIDAQAFVDKDLPKEIWADSSRLMQIIMNLTSNAIKFVQKDAKIHLHAIWYPLDISEEQLLEPVELPAQERPHPNIYGQSISTTIFNQRDLTQRSVSTPRSRSDSKIECTEKEVALRLGRVTSHRHVKSMNGINNMIHYFSESEPWIISRVALNNQQQPTNQNLSRKGYLKVQVSDTGSGIASQNVEQLFQMFTQAHQSVGSMHGGTGLGLWICKQLCQKMHGDIKLHSRLGEGTKVVFYIPITKDSELEVPLTRIKTSRTKVNVLVVDDYAHNRELHRLLLEREGAQVILASNGREAFEKYKAQNEGFFDFVMMDVLMPEMDGFESAQIIRRWEKEQKREKSDIYFVSGEYFNEEEVISAFKITGKTDDITGIRCMRKPVDIEVIKRTVQKHKGSVN